jgi:hypothetical protein
VILLISKGWHDVQQQLLQVLLNKTTAELQVFTAYDVVSLIVLEIICMSCIAQLSVMK